MERPEIPDDCLNDDHDYDQTGRCNECGVYRTDTADGWGDRKTGGAGSRTHALTNEEYREQMEKLGR